MSRAEMRRAAKQKNKTATYNLTEEQINILVKEKLAAHTKEIKKEAAEEAINTAMILLLTLPLEVLMDFYWKKSYAKKIPEFTEHVLDYYSRWENGELDMEKLILVKKSGFLPTFKNKIDHEKTQYLCGFAGFLPTFPLFSLI